MLCSRCRAENREGRRFCAECGASLALTCSSCGFVNEAGEKFCGGCGAPLGPSPRTPEPRFSAPHAYTPKHLAEKILTSKSAQEGERKQVTVLFADLKGSMELLADHDPEDARKVLDPVLERMMEAVHHYEGTVNQVMGDGIMALFGAPLALEDHAVRACYAALRMQGSVKRYADEVHRREGLPIQIRVGLNSGEVVVRSIGSDLRMDYTAVGQTTHLAARIEQMAMPGSILIAPDTLRLVEGLVDVKPLGARPVRGLDRPIEIYEAISAGSARTRLGAATRRGLTRFVGRDAEMELLHHALEEARRGRGQLVAVVGEPGVGKSRLFYEFTRSHRTHGWLVLESSSVSYGQATPYLAVIDLLKRYFKVEGRDDTRTIRAKVTGNLLTLDEALKDTVPAMLWLLDALPAEDAFRALDPPRRRRRTLEAIKRVLLRESQVRPMVLVCEDLHWIDSETQAFLDALVDSLPTAPIVLAVNYRPEYQHRWGGKTYYRQLRIDPLPSESAEELLDGLLGSDPSLLPLKRLLIERTEGNPFFLEESVWTLVETKVLAGERGGYRVTRPPEGLRIPTTVQAVLGARIDRLAPEDKPLLQAASVVGKDVPFALLQAIAELSEEGLRAGLERLRAAEFLYEARLFPDLEYTFKHALTLEVAYASVLQDRRRTLHTRIVGAIEALFAERLSEQVELLADHAVRGETWEKAVPYLHQAGEKAMARSAYREAVVRLERALTALEHLPASRTRLEQAVDIRLDLLSSLAKLGELEQGAKFLREAEHFATTLEDPRRLGRTSVYICLYFTLAGDWRQALTFARRVHDIAEELNDFPLLVAANQYLGGAYLLSGDCRRAEGFLRANVRALHGDLTRELFGLPSFPAVLSGSYLTWCLAERGEFEEGVVHGQETVRVAEAVDHPYSLILACFQLGTLHSLRGEADLAVHLLERCLALFRESKIAIFSPNVTAWLGHAYALSGRVAEGLSLLQQSLSAFETVRLGLYHARAVAYAGEACLLADRFEEAHRFAERALTLARERAQRGYEAWAFRLLGEIASHRDPVDPAGADERYRQALALAADLGMRPLVAHCHLGLGRLYRRTGQREQAPEHLNTAAAMYREMGMRSWLQKAEAEIGELTP